MKTKPEMDDVELEHMASIAAEVGDTAFESICDAALADPKLVADVQSAIRGNQDYATWLARGHERGFEVRAAGCDRPLSRLRALFEAATHVVADVIVWERDVPDAPSELEAWAKFRGRTVERRGGGPHDNYSVLSVEVKHEKMRMTRTIDVYLK